jgi:membrane associated rhomboid family serine protease
MLENRDYMRQSPFQPRRSATLMLVIANAVAFGLQLILENFPGFPLLQYLALSTEGMSHGYLWQLVTFQFMHGGALHLLFNCLAIYVFGRDVEDALGRKSFLTLYFSSGIIGGLFQVISGVIIKSQFSVPVVGASAGAFGLTAAFALLFPDRVLLLFFIIPMRAKFLLVLSLVLALYGIAFPANALGPRVADAAHLGGMLCGIIFVRYAVHWNFRWPRFKPSRGRQPHRLVKIHSQKPGLWGRAKTPAPEDMPADEFLSKEVDPILDKISAQGIQSLTDRERRILEAARTKMGKR